MQNKTNNNIMNITIELSGAEISLGSLNGTVGHSLNIALPKSFTKVHLAHAQKDCEIVLEALKREPKKLASVVNHVAAGDLKKAEVVLEELNLTETDFIKQGGGAAALAVLVFLAVMLYSKKAH